MYLASRGMQAASMLPYMQYASMFYQNGCYKKHANLLWGFLEEHNPHRLVSHGVLRGDHTGTIQHDAEVVRLHLVIFLHDIGKGAYIHGIAHHNNQL